MSPRKLMVTSSLAALLLVPLSAGATPTPAHEGPCALAGFSVTQVVPYRVEERAGRGTVRRLAGASLFVPAQQGLTPEYLQATLEKHLKAMQTRTMAGCPLDVDSISVKVTSAGNGYWVRIAGKDHKAAKEILARSQHLAR
jgi:hypothetical protein